ncbi:hypothetical protein LPJ81_003616 [Coemansia sp. IMI 209127]|nr:hypothetical protein LPJ81_003616 [Coemansia sp. IMI 209127]
MYAADGGVSSAGEWQALVESILVPVYAEKYRLSACTQRKMQDEYVRPHKYYRRVKPVDEASVEDEAYRYSAFADTLALYEKCYQQSHGLAVHDDCGSEKRASMLRAIAVEIANAATDAINAWVRLELNKKYLLASQLLFDCVKLDQRYDKECTLSTATLQALCRADLLPRYLRPVCVDLFEKVDRATMSLPEPLTEMLFALLYQGKCYEQIAYMASDLSAQVMNAELARFALCSIRNEQRRQLLESTIHKAKPRKHEHLHDAEARGTWAQEQSPFGRDARRVLWKLEQRGRQLVSPAHLAKLLEIDMASEAGLPRGIDVFLREFERLDVSPDVHALTLIINTYVERGSHAYACRIYEQMCTGAIVVAQENGEALPRVVSVPQPNGVTLRTIAKVWCAEGDYDRVVGVLESMRQERGMSGAQQLVTRLVASMVDSRNLDAADSVWTKYGCDYMPFAPRHGCKALPRINRRALEKLIIGHSYAGNVDRAISLLQVACSRERPVTGHLLAKTPYLVDLLNTVLRECLNRQHTANDRTLLRRDLNVLNMGIECGVQFNVATYNLLFASLSRAAHAQDTAAFEEEEKEEEEVADSEMIFPASSVTRGEIARVMQRLYRQMLDGNVAPDDTSFVHLVPMWMYVGRSLLAATHWRLAVEGKPPHKAERLRVHVVRQARRWRLSDKALSDLLDSSACDRQTGFA